MVSRTKAGEQPQQHQQPIDLQQPSLNRAETNISEISGSQTITENLTAGTTKTKTTTRGPNYTSEEYCMLSQAYLRRSINPAVGVNQHDERYWDCVHDNYCLLVNQANKTNPKKHPFSPKTSEQLQSAWKRLQRNINKFTGICRQNPRGSGDRDDEVYYKRMRVLFRHQNGSNFSDGHFAAYKYLCKQPKWREKNPETSGNGVNEKDSNSLSAVTSTTSTTVAAARKKRPPGRDHTKMERNAKRAATTVTRNLSAGVRKSNELQEKLFKELRKAREAQEAATNIDIMKHASPAIQRAYADAVANKMLCEVTAAKKRAELNMIQVTAELDNVKAKKTTVTDEDDALELQADDRVDKHEDEMQDDDEEDDYDDEDDLQGVPVDTEQVHAAITRLGACYAFKGPWTVPCFNLRPKVGYEDDLDALKSNISNAIISTVVTSSHEDMRAVTQHLNLEHIRPLPKIHQISDDHKKYNVADYPNAPTDVIKLNEYAEVDESNQAEVMAFNFLCDQLTLEQEGGTNNMWDGEGMM